MGVNLPVRSRFLIRAELPYVAVADEDDVDAGFGDFVVRSKALYQLGGRSSLSVLGTLRTGSGSSQLFPYSSGSTDVQIGLGVVDTVKAVTWWASLTGTYTTRVNDELEDTDLHDNFSTLSGGMLFPIKRVTVQVAGAGYYSSSLATRIMFFTTLDVRYSDSTTFFGLLQGEVGTEEDRAVDYGVAIGMRIMP